MGWSLEVDVGDEDRGGCDRGDTDIGSGAAEHDHRRVRTRSTARARA